MKVKSESESPSVVSDSVRPQRRQPTRLPRPWDSPGKNTGGGCHFLLQCMKVKSESESRSVVSNSLQPQGLYSPWNPPGQNTGVGSLSLLQGIFPTQGSNPGLPHCRQILYRLSGEGIAVNLSLPHPSQVLGWGLDIMRHRNQQILRKRRAQRKNSLPF